MLFAAIDIGSNAARLLFSNVYHKNGVAVAEKATLIRIPLRLGDDVFTERRISQEKTENLVKTITAFKLLIDVYRPVAWAACATSAMRDAANAAEVTALVKEASGVDVKIVSGLEEAEIISAADQVMISDKYKFKMYVDVGGGSTEISMLQGSHIVHSKSFDIGTIRYLNEKVEEKEWDRMKTWLRKFRDESGRIYVIGSGGNINKLAKLYSRNDDQILHLYELYHAHAHLTNFSLEDRIEKMGLRPDRADVIIPAARIFINILKWVRSDFIFVPKIGLADGLVYKLYNNYKTEQASLIAAI